jgi:hypothetical protein
MIYELVKLNNLKLLPKISKHFNGFIMHIRTELRLKDRHTLVVRLFTIFVSIDCLADLVFNAYNC